MKTCIACEQAKPLDEFHYRNRKKGTRHSRCKGCTKEYNRGYYGETKDRYESVRVQSRAKYRAISQQAVIDYLLTHPCVDCGESDIVVLEFDHLSDKEHDIATMVNSGMNPEKVLAEIAKCEVRCANCHRRMTAMRQGGNYRTRALGITS